MALSCKKNLDGIKKAIGKRTLVQSGKGVRAALTLRKIEAFGTFYGGFTICFTLKIPHSCPYF